MLATGLEHSRHGLLSFLSRQHCITHQGIPLMDASAMNWTTITIPRLFSIPRFRASSLRLCFGIYCIVYPAPYHV